MVKPKVTKEVALTSYEVELISRYYRINCRHLLKTNEPLPIEVPSRYC